MSYLGRGVDAIDNISTLDNLSFNGSDATFNLTQNSVAFVPVSADALQIQIDGIIQSGNYTVSGSTVTFDFTPSGSSVCNGIKHFGVGVLTSPSDGSVTTAKLGADAVTTAKINDGAVTSGKIASGVIPTFRPNANPYIVNGNFDVWQRGTSFTTSVYTADRWLQDLSGATATVTRETHTVGQTDVPDNPKYYLKQNVTTGNNNCGMLYRIEDVDTLTGAFTLSFYAKGVNPNSGNLDIIIQQNFGSGGSTTVSLTEQDLTLTGSWQKFVFTGTLASLSGKTIGTSSYIQIIIKQPDDDSNTSAWNLQISQVQLESGTYTSSTIPPFQHESYGDNLRRCQRYYFKYLEGASKTVGIGSWWNDSNIDTVIHFPVSMRTDPSLSATSGTNYYYICVAGNCRNISNAWTAGRTNPTSSQIYLAPDATDTGGRAGLVASTNASSFIAWDSEL